MIYKDDKSSGDREAYPAERGNEPCLHCGMAWTHHSYWACVRVLARIQASFSVVPENERYLTQSMKDSLYQDDASKIASLVATSLGLKTEPAAKASKDPDDWRAWRNDRPGECACGIVRSRCDYHR